MFLEFASCSDRRENTYRLFAPSPLRRLAQANPIPLAEERELTDAGDMLRRVIAIQEGLLAFEDAVLSVWLHAAERPN